MKNKKLLYILIPGTLLVWGMIIYRVVAAASGDDPAPFQMNSIAEEVPAIQNDTFSINPIYRDPFLGKLNAKQTIAPVKTSGTIIKKEPVKVNASWPSVVYGGIIKNQKSNKQLVLITVNGQSVMLKVGEKVQDVEILKVFKDSIEVRFGKEKKYIRK